MAYDVTQSATTPRLIDLPIRAIGGQPAFTAARLDRFLREPRVAVLAFRRGDGRANQTPIWYRYDGSTLTMSTQTGSPKHRALLADPRVTITIQDERPPYRAVIIDAVAHLAPIAPEDPVGDPTKDMDVRYFGRLGALQYRKLTAAAYAATGLTSIRLEPTAVRGLDNTQALSWPTLAFVRLRDHLPIPRGWL